MPCGLSASATMSQSCAGSGEDAMKPESCPIHGGDDITSWSYVHLILSILSVEQFRMASWFGSTRTLSGNFVISAVESEITPAKNNTVVKQCQVPFTQYLRCAAALDCAALVTIAATVLHIYRRSSDGSIAHV